MQGLGLVHVCPTLIRMLVAAQGGDVAALGPGVRVHIKPLPQKEDGVGGKNKNKVKGHERSNNADVSGIKRAHDVHAVQCEPNPGAVRLRHPCSARYTNPSGLALAGPTDFGPEKLLVSDKVFQGF